MVSIIRALAGEPSIPVGFPILFDADMAIIEPAFLWLMEHAELSGRAQATETVRTYGEHLHDWFDSLEQSGIEWREADERVIATYRSFGSVGAPAAIMDALPKLEMIGLFSVGYDKVDVDHARSKGIRVTNTPDVLTDDVADLAVGLLYATVRNIAANDRLVRPGGWARGEKPALAGRVTGATIGILGLGRIGRAIAKRLEPVAGEILYHNRKPAADTAYRYVADAIDFARQSEVVIVATSGGPEAAKLVDGAMLDALGPDGVIVNISRGGVIDETAMVERLADRRIAGAGLDVFAHEPHVPEALFAMDHVVLQPHQGSATVHTRKAMADLVVANLDAWFGGEALLTPVV